LQKALALAKEIGNPLQLWESYQTLGEVYGKQGTTERACTASTDALEVIDGVASRLQDQELERTFLAAQPVREIRKRLNQ